MIDFAMFLLLASLFHSLGFMLARLFLDEEAAIAWPIALARWLGKPATIIIFILTVALIAYQGALIMRLERQLTVCDDDTESYFP